MLFALLGGGAVAASRAMSSSQGNAWLLVDLAGIVVGLLGGLVFPSLSIRCPRCRVRWFWMAISSQKHDEWFSWLFAAEACPECGYNEDN